MSNVTMRLGAFVAGAFALSLAAQAAAQTAEPIRIGGIFTLTGAAATLGFNTMTGAKLAIKEINEKGGIMGRQVTLITADDQGNPTITTSEAKRLVHEHKVHVALGPVGSLTTLPSIPIFNEAKVMNISVAQAGQLTPAFAPYHFTPVVNTDEIAKVYIDYAVDVLKVKSVAILHDNTAGNQALMPPMRAHAATRGLNITAVQEFELNVTDMVPQILSVRRTNPEALLHSGLTPKDAGAAVKALGEVGWNIRIAFSTSMAAGIPAVLQVAGPQALKSDRIVAWDYKSLTYCTGDPVGQSGVAQFLVRLKAFEPAQFEKISATNALWMYDAVYILKAAIEGAKTTDGPALATWLERNAASVPALLGKLAASSSSHFLIDSTALTMIENLDQYRADGLRKRVGC